MLQLEEQEGEMEKAGGCQDSQAAGNELDKIRLVLSSHKLNAEEQQEEISMLRDGTALRKKSGNNYTENKWG